MSTRSSRWTGTTDWRSSQPAVEQVVAPGERPCPLPRVGHRSTVGRQLVRLTRTRRRPVLRARRAPTRPRSATVYLPRWRTRGRRRTTRVRPDDHRAGEWWCPGRWDVVSRRPSRTSTSCRCRAGRPDLEASVGVVLRRCEHEVRCGARAAGQSDLARPRSHGGKVSYAGALPDGPCADPTGARNPQPAGGRCVARLFGLVRAWVLLSVRSRRYRRQPAPPPQRRSRGPGRRDRAD